ncbi:MAG: hypothetical protein J7578_05210 [Chitinophagaceae bacterium]|nr:hypothetical protein [Chitinophagaceae bacterium]
MRKHKQALLLICLLMAISFIGQAQPGDVKRYVVITIEKKNSKSFEGDKRTCWIISETDLNDTSNHFLPLLIDGYFQTDIDSCCSGKFADPHLNAAISLNAARAEALGKLQSLIWPRRRLVQSIKTNSNGAKMQINISATPVFGSFCACKFGPAIKQLNGYAGDVLLPYIDISYNDEFWDSDKAWVLKHIDFTDNYFDSNMLYNVLR